MTTSDLIRGTARTLPRLPGLPRAQPRHVPTVLQHSPREPQRTEVHSRARRKSRRLQHH